MAVLATTLDIFTPGSFYCRVVLVPPASRAREVATESGFAGIGFVSAKVGVGVCHWSLVAGIETFFADGGRGLPTSTKHTTVAPHYDHPDHPRTALQAHRMLRELQDAYVAPR